MVDWGIARIQSLYKENPEWVSIDASLEYKEYRKTSVAEPHDTCTRADHGDLIDGRVDVYAVGIAILTFSQSNLFRGRLKKS